VDGTKVLDIEAFVRAGEVLAEVQDGGQVEVHRPIVRAVMLQLREDLGRRQLPCEDH
jgi:hypothetical protein